MNLVRRYIKCVHLLVLLGVVAYSVAEEDLIYVMIAAPVTLAAYLIVGGPGGRPIPRWGINLAFLLATLMMANHWANAMRGDTISVLCSYLVWLQLIKLFEPRTPRDQAQIILLSLMLVVGACLTSVTIELGAVLTVYIPLLLITSMLFQVYAAHARATREDTPAVSPGAPAGTAVWRRIIEWIIGGGGTRVHAPLPRTAHAGRSARSDLTRCALTAGVIIALIAPVVYITMPRGVGEGLFGRLNQAGSSQPVTGFRNHVQLGSQGLLSESLRVVMTVKVESPDDPSAGFGRPHHLRGAVLDLYDSALGTWRRSRYVESTDRRVSADAADHFRPTSPAGPLYILHITTDHPPVNELFTKWRPLRATWPTGGRQAVYQYNTFDGRMSTANPGRGMTYTVVCAPMDDSPPDAVPFVARSAVPPLEAEWLTGLTGRGEPMPPRPSPQFQQGPIRDLAVKILAESRIDPSDDHIDGARPAVGALIRHLQRHYTYTTRMTSPLPGEDPIEMFLFDEARGLKGHCEYFASALAAMCLSVGIPARVITGYIASEYDAARGVYIVRENHAHAWVEAEIHPGRWETFDPSPSSEVGRLHHPQGLIASAFRRFMDTVQLAWIEGVVAFNRDRQATALQSFGVAPLDALRALNERIAKMLATEEEIAQENRTVFFTRLFGWIVLLGSASLLGIHFAATRLIRLVSRSFGRGSAREIEKKDPMLAEMSRLAGRALTMLARAGHSKPRSEPAGSFIRSLEDRYPAIAGPAIALIERYYRARFAGITVTRDDLDFASGRLRELSNALKHSQRQNSPTISPDH